ALSRAGRGDGRGDPRLGGARRRDGAAPVVHVPHGRGRARGGRPGVDARPRARGPARRRRERVPLRYEREHLCADDDGRREGSRPDPRAHAASAVGGAVLPPRGRGISSLTERTVGEFLAALGERTPTPASGAATALTAALAAALVELAARFAGDGESVVRAKAHWSRLAELADEDAEAYLAFMASRTDETRARIVAVPEEIAAAADEVAVLADHVKGQLRTSVVGDA